MTDTDHNHLPIAALIRAAADDELTAAQREALDAYVAEHPADADRVAAAIESEKMLRAACGRVMADCPAPSKALHDKVAGVIAASRQQADQLADSIEASSEQTRDRGFWAGFAASPAVRSLGAVAAIVLLGLTLFLAGAPIADTPAAHAKEVASFVSGEHNRCASDPSASGKFTVTEIASVPERYAGLTGQAVTVADILDAGAAGLRFIDAGACHVPGSKASMHIRFETDGHPDCPDKSQVSLFIQPYSGYLELPEEGKAYCLTSYNLPGAEASGSGAKTKTKAKTVLAWRRDGLSYVLVSDRTEACPRVLESAGLPAQPEQI